MTIQDTYKKGEQSPADTERRGSCPRDAGISRACPCAVVTEGRCGEEALLKKEAKARYSRAHGHTAPGVWYGWVVQQQRDTARSQDRVENSFTK